MNSDDDGDDITHTANVERGLDTATLYKYCQGVESFPVGVLEKSQVDADGIDFVKCLLVVNPRLRATATAALDSPWLAVIDPPEINPTVTGPALLRIQFKLLGILLSPEDA